MALSETRRELLQYLDEQTRSLDAQDPERFTTTGIARALNVSRSLASQYANDLVRDGLTLKVNSRPVLFLHKAGMERYLQHRLDQAEYPSLNALFSSAGVRVRKDFDRAVGADGSLAPSIMRIKSAIEYPPSGLPVHIAGERGTGKAFLARLAFEYGRNMGLMPPTAQFVRVDCVGYQEGGSLAADLRGTPEVPGAVERAKGGVVFFDRFDRLSHGDREAALSYIRHAERRDASEPSARFILASCPGPDGSDPEELMGAVPIGVWLPPLRERVPEERSELARSFLRSEGRRAAVNVSISRGAMRTLINAEYDDNIEGLHTAVINGCAAAYLGRTDDRVVIQTFNLPSSILGAAAPLADDSQILDCDDPALGPGEQNGRFQTLMEDLIRSWRSYEAGEMSMEELRFAGFELSHEVQDLLDFETSAGLPQMQSYERVLTPIVEHVNAMYGIELTRKMSHTLGQLLHMQVWGGREQAAWKDEHRPELEAIVEVISHMSRTTAVVVDQMDSEVRTALGHELDPTTRIVLSFIVKELSDNVTDGRERMGVVLCHGYSTATSIAEAANRILHRRVFEAVDMRYEQQASDVVGTLTRIVERYAYCPSIALLIDTGSLAEVSHRVAELTGADVYACDNVSTGLAVEVGAGLISGEDLAGVFQRCEEAYAPHCDIVYGHGGYDAVVFCSENGASAADSLRDLVSKSMPRDTPVRLVTADYHELLRAGTHSSAFGNYAVRAIVGTMDPGVPSVPFVGVEEVLFHGSSEVLDRVFAPTLGADGIAEFHANLVRNLTLRNVAVSITILNPEILYLEADRAVQRLAQLTGETIDERRRIAVYVHLCGLVERLVTKSFVETYPDLDAFAAEHGDFVRQFREAFSDLSRRYQVEIPVSEVAYVYRMLHGPEVSLPISPGVPVLEDE